jgi:type I restriction enzyme, S subunit
MNDSVPDGWSKVEFGNFTTLQRGKDLTKAEFREGTVPVAGSNGVIGYHDTAVAKAPGITVGRSGSAGKVTVYEEDFWPHNTSLYVRDFHGNDPYFAGFLLGSLNLARFKTGASVPTLDRNSFKTLPLLVPPLPEQKKIAHILSTVQRAIKAQERIIQTTTELKKALMHKLFTEGLRHEPQKQTEIGPVPESWEVVPLGEFIQIKHGYAFDGKFFKPSGDHILMTPGHFYEEGGFREQGEKTKYFTGEIPQDYVLAKDDLVVAMTEQTSGLLGSAAFVPEDDSFLHNQRLGLIVDLNEKRLSKRFLFYLFNHPHLRVEVAKTSTGSKVKHTSPTKLRAVKVGIPTSLDEQEEIASALSTTQQKISVATNKKTQLQDLFRTLLHELMTAKTRVHELELPLPS